MSYVQGRCETCAAFHRVRDLPDGRKVGHCAIEALPSPVPSTATCSRYRSVGGPPPPPPRRVAGEPRGRGGSASTPTRDRSTAAKSSAQDPIFSTAPLPKEIDLEMDTDEFRRVLRQVLAEELAISPVELGGRWQGGELVLKPGKEGTAEKRVPIETFFHKIVMIRDKLRVLEAKLNSSDKLTPEDKVQLQQYVTNCYGSLTTFNVLFAEKNDSFSGQGGDQ